MLLIRNVITITNSYFVRAPQTKFPSGMLPVGIETTGRILHNTRFSVSTKHNDQNEQNGTLKEF